MNSGGLKVLKAAHQGKASLFEGSVVPLSNV